MATSIVPTAQADPLDDAETRELAIELARRTGQSPRDAVKNALREALVTTREARIALHDADVQKSVDAIRDVTAGVREGFIARYGFVPTNEQFDDWMYDEIGLPR